MAQPKIAQLVTTLACIYGVGVLSSLFWRNRAMAIVTQGSLEKLREMMFNRMQHLPIRYFDTHQHGDIMSHYTNDIDTLRQMITQSMPNLLMSIIFIVTGVLHHAVYSVWMMLIIFAVMSPFMIHDQAAPPASAVTSWRSRLRSAGSTAISRR